MRSSTFLLVAVPLTSWSRSVHADLLLNGVCLLFGRPPYLEDRLESMNGLLTFDLR